MERFPTVLLFIVLAAVACLMPAQSDTWWQLWYGGRHLAVGPHRSPRRAHAHSRGSLLAQS